MGVHQADVDEQECNLRRGPPKHKEGLWVWREPARFRHAAGGLWSIHDPVNVRGVKDLMVHTSYDKTTEKYYVMSQSRLAGRVLAKVLDARRR